MKRGLFLLVVFFLCLGVNAQKVFEKGDIVANVHVGIGGGPGDHYTMALPPLSISAEYGIVDNLFSNNNGSIGVGALIGYGGYKRFDDANPWYKYDNKYKRICFGARGTFHYQFVDKLDTYAGIMLGLYSNSVKTKSTYKNPEIPETITYTKTTNMDFAFSLYVGARYYFNESFGAGIEAGYGFSTISLVISYKL